MKSISELKNDALSSLNEKWGISIGAILVFFPINGIKLNAILIAKKTRIAPIEIPHFSLKLESASFFNSEIDFITFFLSNAKIINSFHTHIIKYRK